MLFSKGYPEVLNKDAYLRREISRQVEEIRMKFDEKKKEQ